MPRSLSARASLIQNGDADSSYTFFFADSDLLGEVGEVKSFIRVDSEREKLLRLLSEYVQDFGLRYLERYFFH